MKKTDDLTVLDTSLDNAAIDSAINEIKNTALEDDIKPIDEAIKEGDDAISNVNSQATVDDDIKADMAMLNDTMPADNVTDDIVNVHTSTDPLNDLGDIDFIKDVEKDGAFKEVPVEDELPSVNAKELKEQAEDLPPVHVSEHAKTTDDNFAYSYDWDDASYNDFEQIYLYDFDAQLAKAQKSNAFSLIISVALVMFCIFMATQVLLGVRQGSIMFYLVGMLVGAFSFIFVKSYPEKAKAKAIGNLRNYLYTNEFHLRINGDSIDAGSDVINFKDYDSAVIYKDVLLLVSKKLNSFLMINLKDNVDAPKLLDYIKSRPYIETSVEDQPFSLSKYGIVAKK